MNFEALLALLADLYANVETARRQITELSDRLTARTAENSALKAGHDDAD